LNIGYSMVVTWRRERLVFFDVVDELCIKGLISGESQTFMRIVCDYMRRITKTINRVALSIMMLASVSSLFVIFWGALDQNAEVSVTMAVMILTTLMIPPFFFIGLNAFIIRYCRHTLSTIIRKDHSETFLRNLNEFASGDSVVLDQINEDLIESWKTTEQIDDIWKYHRKEMSINFWTLFLPPLLSGLFLAILTLLLLVAAYSFAISVTSKNTTVEITQEIYFLDFLRIGPGRDGALYYMFGNNMVPREVLYFQISVWLLTLVASMWIFKFLLVDMWWRFGVISVWLAIVMWILGTIGASLSLNFPYYAATMSNLKHRGALIVSIVIWLLQLLWIWFSYKRSKSRRRHESSDGD
jgi:hypothetical protein